LDSAELQEMWKGEERGRTGHRETERVTERETERQRETEHRRRMHEQAQPALPAAWLHTLLRSCALPVGV